MKSDHFEDNRLMEIFELLKSQSSGGIKTILEILYNAAMKIERDDALQATPYERTESRQGYANGFKEKSINTRMGTLNLNVPKTREIGFYPQCLEKGSRSERALKLAIAEMYLKGVSTRKVESITRELCGLDISATQVSRLSKELDDEFEKFRNRPIGKFRYVFFDASYLKIRHDGSVIDMAVLISYGINEQGKREILGASTDLSEAEVHWRKFFKSLVERGLSGIELVVSDDHQGLAAARKAVFPSVPWQRCQFHMSQNAQGYAPKKHLRSEIAQAMKDIFNSPSAEIAREMKEKISLRFSESAPHFTKWLDENIEEGLTCFKFPVGHRKKIRTTNGLERVNREIKRRTRVAVLFPNEESALRLVTGVLVEIHDEWVTGKQYMDMNL